MLFCRLQPLGCPWTSKMTKPIQKFVICICFEPLANVGQLCKEFKPNVQNFVGFGLTYYAF